MASEPIQTGTPPTRSATGRGRRWYLTLFGILGIGVALSVFVCLLLLGSEWTRIQRDVDAVASERFRLFSDRLDHTLGIGSFVHDAFLAAPGLTRTQFGLLTRAPFDAHAGIAEIGWAPLVTDAERETIRNRAHLDGLVSFEIREMNATGELAISGRRSEYLPLLYEEPPDSRPDSYGFDLLSERERRDAVRLAQYSNEPAATGELRFVASDTQGVLVFYPVVADESRPGEPPVPGTYRLKGVLIVALDAEALLTDTVAITEPGGLDMVITDDTTGQAEILAEHRSRARTGTPPDDLPALMAGADPSLQRRYPITVADRTWSLHISAIPQFVTSRRTAVPWIALAVGLVLTTALGTYGARTQSARQRAEDRAGEMQKLNAELQSEIARRERAEDVVRQSQRLEAVAELAGGIAHDFNNLLAAALGSVTLARETVASLGDSAAEVDEDLRATQDACLHARDLARRLLAFAKDEPPKRQLTLLVDTIRAATRFALSGARHRVHFSFDDPLWPAEIDVTQITQLLDNLIINAAQAMDTPGRIEVSATNEMVFPDNALNLVPGPYVVIRIVDQGPGIPATHQARLFEPFFTTKKTGSGLGLPISFRIAERHGGLLGLEDTGTGGTTFALHLPATPDAPQPTETPVRMGTPTSGHALVIDDEPHVRRTLSRMLERLGWSVDEAPTGEEGLRVLAAAHTAGRPHDLIILDLTMPGGLDGVEVARRTKELTDRPLLVLSSGYAPEDRVGAEDIALFDGQLGKPYTFDELRSLLIQLWGPAPAPE